MLIRGKIMRRTRDYKEHLLESLKDPKERVAYLNAALKDKDSRVFLVALKDVIDSCGGISKIAKESSSNRESLYKTLSLKRNPHFANLLAMLRALGFEVCIYSANA
jgi:probable addiction module antidote protein